MKERKIWIRYPYAGKAVGDIQRYILSLGEEDLLGEIPIILYDPEARNTYALSHTYDVSEIALPVLKEQYGDNNVKLVEKDRIYTTEPPSPTDQIVNALDNIADQISELNETMTQMCELLERCENRGPYGSMLAISGTVETI